MKIKKIIKIACGYDHSMVLTNNGKVFCWGNNEFNQCESSIVN